MRSNGLGDRPVGDLSGVDGHGVGAAERGPGGSDELGGRAEPLVRPFGHAVPDDVVDTGGKCGPE